MGCTDSNACNEDSDATNDDGSCYYANNVNETIGGPDLLYLNCDETCISDTDGDGVCDGVISGCTDEAACNYDEDATVDDGSCDCVSYLDDIQPILNSNCSGCHIGGTAGNLDLNEDTSYNNLVNIVSSGYSPDKLVTSGDAANSVLWNKVAGTGANGSQMPMGGQLTQDEIDLIEDWINEGVNPDPPTIFNLILEEIR